MRVLSIDGGGVRGVVPSVMLAYWENELKFETPERFDLYAGTSTGAMVAAALALGMSARRVLMLFQEHADAIFSRDDLKWAERALSFKGWAIPAYSHEALRATLTEAYGGATMGDCPKPLSIPSLDVVTGSSRVFRSRHHAGSEADWGVSVVDAVVASTAAPTFFPSAEVAGSTFVDGALWANNPSMIALLDARDLLGHSTFDAIRVLSLGCGRPFWGRPQGYGGRRGLVGWGGPLMSLMFAAQAEGVHRYTDRLLGPTQYLRIDPLISRDLAGLDEVENIPELVARAGEEARASQNGVSELLADGG